MTWNLLQTKDFGRITHAVLTLSPPSTIRTRAICPDFGIVGISHRNCEIRALGEFTRDPATRTEIARGLLQFGAGEVVILSTCNRFEVLFTHDARARAAEFVNLIFTMFARRGSRIPNVSFALDGESAVNHLFEVACSLDSLVVGELQILGQLRAAIDQAEAAGTLGPRLRYITSEAFRVARRVRRETSLCRGASVVSLATEQLRRASERCHSMLPVALVGAGEMTEQAATSLSKRGGIPLLFINRTHSKALALAKRFGGAAMEFDTFLANPPAIAALLTSTSAPNAIFTKIEGRALLAARGAVASNPASDSASNPLQIVDLAVPFDVAPDVRTLENVVVYSIDDLRAVAAERVERQRAEIERARQLLVLRLGRLAEREIRRADGLAFGGARARGESAAARAVTELKLRDQTALRRMLARATETSHRVAHAFARGMDVPALLQKEETSLRGAISSWVDAENGRPWARKTLDSIALAVANA